MSRTFLGEELIHVTDIWGRSLFMSRTFEGGAYLCQNMPNAQTCPNQSPPDVYSVAVMTQSLMTQP
jgi:hypothetical protein